MPGGAPLSAAERAAERYTDGEWHRLHPATPLLRGGIVFIAVFGFVLSNLRERLISFFVGAPDYGGDPLDAIYDHGWEGWALLGVAVVLLLCFGAFYLSWRMHSFRITGDAVEVRSGILFRTQRKARLDRIQGINVVRPLLARIFGAAKMDISVAGHDANVQLAYLGSSLADGLRGDVLRLASGVRAAEAAAAQGVPPAGTAGAATAGGATTGAATPGAATAGAATAGAATAGPAALGAFPAGFGAPGAVTAGGAAAGVASAGSAAPGAVTASGAAAGVVSAGSAPAASGAPGAATAGASRAAAVGDLVGRRVNEFLAPELDPNAAPPESVVKIPPLRLLGSLLLSGFTVFVVIVVAFLVWGASTGSAWLLIVVLPGLIGSASFYINRFTKSLRYSIAGTPDGVRVGFGLLSTSNETLPPGRIHAVEVLQPLLWRPFGWWQIRIDTAGHSREKGAAGQPNTTMLPVGDATDVSRVLALVLPGLAAEEQRRAIEAGMVSPGRDGFVGSPRRAVWLRPLSWRRTGYLLLDDVVLLRRGFVWRSLAVVPLARLQSLELKQGPLEAALTLADARFHTVSGPVRPRLAAIDAPTGVRLFEEVAARAIAAAAADLSHRWGSAAPQGQSAPAAPTPATYTPPTEEEH